MTPTPHRRCSLLPLSPIALQVGILKAELHITKAASTAFEAQYNEILESSREAEELSEARLFQAKSELVGAQKRIDELIMAAAAATAQAEADAKQLAEEALENLR